MHYARCVVNNTALDIAYMVGKAHGMRSQGNHAHIFLPVTSTDYHRYNKGYTDGVASTQKDIAHAERARPSRLRTATHP